MLTLRQIEVFRAVMQSGSIAGAGRVLRVSQPTVTRLVRRMEDELGVTLFTRNAGRLFPSRSAERFLAEIDIAFLQMNAAIERAAETSQPDLRSIRIGASASVGRRLVPEVLANILQRQPKLSIQLDVLTVNQVQPYLLDGGGDAAITLFPILQEDIRSTALGKGRPVLLTPRTLEFQAIDPSKAEDLQHMAWIVFEPNSVHGDIMGSILSDADLRPVRTHRVRLAETGVGLVEAGLGACIVDEFSAMATDERAVRKTFWRTERHYEVHLHRKITSADHALIDQFAKNMKQKLAASYMP